MQCNISFGNRIQRIITYIQQIPLIVILSLLPLYDFSDRYIAAFEKNPFFKYIIFENGFDISFSILEFQNWDYRVKQGKDTRISNFEESVQFSFRKNKKNCSSTSEPLMLKILLRTLRCQ